jgi:polysaccharide pyruvyl transferase WcaK-like protein
MRLHALIFAASGGVPVVGLAYDPKVSALLSRLGLSPATTVEGFSAPAVAHALRETWNDRAQRSVQMAEAARELAAVAQVSARRASELLAASPSRTRIRPTGHGRAPSGRTLD